MRPDALTSDQIRAMTDDIMASQLSPHARQVHFRSKYPQLRDDYPALFQMCCDQGPSTAAILDFMLKQLSLVESTEKSQFDASKTVGEELSKHYIEPLLGAGSAPPPSED